MSRELRRVPKGFQHPTNEAGHFIPLYDGHYETAAADWLAGCILWSKGLDPRQKEEWCTDKYYWEYEGMPPREEDYMPPFDSDPTHFMMYETCSEGTPISPAFETIEGLARWLANTGASSFGTCTATYEQWLSTCKAGYAIGAVYTHKTGFISGVEATTELKG